MDIDPKQYYNKCERLKIMDDTTTNNKTLCTTNAYLLKLLNIIFSKIPTKQFLKINKSKIGDMFFCTSAITSVTFFCFFVFYK